MNKKAQVAGIIAVVVLAVAIIGVALYTTNMTGRAVANKPQCSDAIDNDGDGRCDYITTKRCRDGSQVGDAQCSSSSDNKEAPDCTSEVCDGIDNNCDSQIDNGLGSTTCGLGTCQRTVQNCAGGALQTCTPGSPSPEECGDNIDNDCDGLVDEGCGIPDSCTDSDGGNIQRVKGSVSGHLNSALYNNTDTCITNTTLQEYYCTGSYANNATAKCLNGTTSCSNGRCI